jgi:hypothetical protein
MNSKLVSTALCTEDILMASESCDLSHDLEAEFYV